MLTAFIKQVRSKPTKYWSIDLSILARKLRPLKANAEML